MRKISFCLSKFTFLTFRKLSSPGVSTLVILGHNLWLVGKKGPAQIRKALNSRQTLKQNFLLYRNGAYQLNSELSYLIDTEDFSRFVAEAEKAHRNKNTERFRENVQAAHKIYRGDFMAEIYEDWAEELRSFYREQYARILKRRNKV
ncbi:MAG: hypothetical protein M3525_15510 [Acidobacteriota bacterium]|nr:hypothetical protein [Acidobacteriota bacterium]